MPARLRPCAPIAAAAVLVGDPGRALLLAQELLEQPKMCNHARGLWGYSGRTSTGLELTVQSTGMGGPSAAVVLTDLAELGLRRAVRVGTCTALDPELPAGALLDVSEARSCSLGPHCGPKEQPDGSRDGEAGVPDPELAARLSAALGVAARAGAVASLDVLHEAGAPAPLAAAADMQTATLLRRGSRLGLALAAVLIVTRAAAGEQLGAEEEERAARRAGAAAVAALSTST